MATRKASGDNDGVARPVAELSYSDAGAELDGIIAEFETGVVDVDRLVDQLERATEIVDELDHRLRRTRMRVEELVPRLEAIGQDGTVDEEIEEIEDTESDALF
ncbi:MAG: exodeoxyribonuclease VII small subunit [Acidimicrobiales bacterium]|jgi:exodeoxyribonuclease VII small subunit